MLSSHDVAYPMGHPRGGTNRSEDVRGHFRLPRSVVGAVAARDAQRGAAFSHAHGISQSHGSNQELVENPDIDVVSIATTHGQHHEQALLALRSGKPVLVEKAFSLNAWQFREVGVWGKVPWAVLRGRQ